MHLIIIKKSYLVGNFINIDSKNKILKYFYAFIPQKKINKFFYYNQIFTGAFFFRKKYLEHLRDSILNINMHLNTS